MYTGHCGKEGLRALKQSNFSFKISPEGSEYIEVNFNPKTKTNQGDNVSSVAGILHNNRGIISAQPGSMHCPVNSFKHYIDNLQPSIPDFFQRPSKDSKSYDMMHLGKNPSGDIM